MPGRAPTAAFLATLAVACTASTIPVWQQWGINPQHTSRSGNPGPLTATRAWTAQPSGNILTSPVIGGYNDVYVVTIDGYLVGVDSRSGATNWKSYIGVNSLGDPAVSNDGKYVYVGSANGTVFAFYTAVLGQVAWTFQTTGEIYRGPAITQTTSGPGNVIIGGSDGVLHALDGSSGKQLWSFNAPSMIMTNPALALDNTVYFGITPLNTSTPSLYALNGDTGQLLWAVTTGGQCACSNPVLGKNNVLYAASDNGVLYALDSTSGGVLWQYSTGNQGRAGVALGFDGQLYAGTSTGQLVSLVSSTGDENWVVTVSGSAAVYATPVVTKSAIYLASKGGAFAAYNPVNGAPIWTFSAVSGAAGVSSVAINLDGMMYVALGDPWLLAFKDQ